MADLFHILVTGGGGQVGQELVASAWPENVRIHAPGRSELDLSDAASIRGFLARKPFAAVINAGAYTGVDKAETEVAAAYAANAIGPAILAEITHRMNTPLVHVSTDYVFDGQGQGAYDEDAAVAPQSVYGHSKLAGELAVRSGNPRSVVLRTAWVLSVHRANFLKTMLRLAADRSELRVVGDQIGCPTGARDIAATLQTITLHMIESTSAPTGVYHFVNSGEASWATLAREIFAQSAKVGGPSAEVQTIATSEYPTPARRPANSRLSTNKLSRDYQIAARPWQDMVAEIVTELHEKGAAS